MRNLTIAITGACSIDAHKAFLKRVGEIEQKYADNPASVGNLATATVVVTGALPHKIHVFTVTTTMATGTYAATFVETKPNV